MTKPDTKFKIIASLIAIAILALWHRSPQIAQAVRPQFVTVYDSTCFSHDSGRWEVNRDGLKKVKNDKNKQIKAVLDAKGDK